jgi:hypothetical protein
MNKTIFLIVSISVLTLAVGTASSVSNTIIIIPTVLAAKKNSSSNSSGAVSLIPIQTGNAKLDNEIQSFYNCIKKTGHTGGSKPEPSKSEVINCYFKKVGNGNNV